jgi:hypothetical protein
VSGRREYGGERAEAGTGMNRNKPESNRKSTTLLTITSRIMPVIVSIYVASPSSCSMTRVTVR